MTPTSEKRDVVETEQFLNLIGYMKRVILTSLVKLGMSPR